MKKEEKCDPHKSTHFLFLWKEIRTGDFATDAVLRLILFCETKLLCCWRGQDKHTGHFTYLQAVNLISFYVL